LLEWLKQIKKLNDDITEYKKDSDIPSMPSVAIVNRAKKFINEGNLDEAENILKEAFSLAKEDSLVFKYLGIVYDGKKDYEKAIEAYQKSADLNQEDKDIWRFLGTAFLNTCDYERSIKAFENANKITPLNTDIFTGWGMAYMKLKNYKEAREKFVQAIKINRYNFLALFFSAMCETRIGMMDLAETKLHFLTSTVPNDINCYEYANLKFLKNHIQEAEFWAKKSIEYNSQIIPAYTLLIKIYSQKQDLENCKKYYEEGCKNGLEGDNLNENFGIALLNLGQINGAKLHLLKAYENNLDNENITANLLLINTILQEDKYIELLQGKLYSLNSLNPILKITKSIFEYREGNFSDALTLIKEVYDGFDNEYILDYYLALIYAKLGQLNKAKESFESSSQKCSMFVKNYIDWANFLIENGEFNDAQRKLRKGLKYNNGDINLLNLLFHVSFILVKDNVCEYNIKDAISIASKIEPQELFEYKNELSELEQMLGNIEREKN